MDILIVEDEEYTLKYLEKIVSGHPRVNKIIATQYGNQAINLVEEYKPNIVFLDIELAPTETFSGLDIAKLIRDRHPQIHIVFITGYHKYALDSFAVHPYDYILKPFKPTRVLEVLSNLEMESNNDYITNNKLVFKYKDSMIFLTPDDVLFIEKQGKKGYVHSYSGVFEINVNLKDLKKCLPSCFVQTHKSFIVNIDKIHKMEYIGNRAWEISFINYNSTALVSRYRFKEVKKRLMLPI